MILPKTGFEGKEFSLHSLESSSTVYEGKWSFSVETVKELLFYWSYEFLKVFKLETLEFG